VLNLVNQALSLGNQQQPTELLEARCARLLRLDAGLLARLPLAAA
jgi:hypothetical protein